MRTTLDIDDSVLAAAKEIAGASNSSAGAVISDLARKGLTLVSPSPRRRQPGFPVFPVSADAPPLSLSTVKALLNDEGVPARR